MEGKLTEEFKQQLLEEVKVLIRKSKEEMIVDLYHFNRSRMEDKHELTDQLSIIKNEINLLKQNNNLNLSSKRQQIDKYQLTDDALTIREQRQNQELTKRVNRNLRNQDKKVDFVDSRDDSILKVKELQDNVLALRRGFQEKIAHFQENYVKLQSTMIDHRSKHLWRFEIRDNIIQLKETDGSTHYQLLGRIPISKKSVNHFTVYSNWFHCGIMNRNYFGQENSWDKKESIIYTSQGKLFVSGKNQSQKQRISYGDKLTMTVQDNIITWKVNNQLINSCLNAMIQNPHIIWVPYIKLTQKGTKVVWQ